MKKDRYYNYVNEDLGQSDHSDVGVSPQHDYQMQGLPLGRAPILDGNPETKNKVLRPIPSKNENYAKASSGGRSSAHEVMTHSS